MALVSKTFSQIITFTRASTATYFDATGTLQSAAIDAPRLDYNPSTLAAQGLLIEEARANVLLYSEELNNVLFWTPQQASITANAATSPSNTLTADKLVEDTSTNVHNSYCFPTGPAAGTPFTVSVFAKASERTAFAIDVRASGSGFRSVFNLTAATASGAVIGTGTLVSTSITNVGNGWFRCAVTGSHPTDTIYNVTFRLNNPAGTDSYTGNGTSGLFLWGAQMETGAFPTSYIPTTTIPLTRSADVASVNTLSPWFNATQGTLYSEASLFGFGTTPAVTSFSDGTDTGNLIQTNTSGAGLVRYRVTIGGVAQVNNLSSGVTATTNTTFKAATGYAASDFAISVNGTAAITQASGNVPTPTQLRLLQTGSGGSVFSGYLRRITYYPRKLSSAELQAITA